MQEIPKEGQTIFGHNEPPKEDKEDHTPLLEESAPKEPPKPKAIEGPVSKWTLVDYDNDDSADPGYV